MGKKQKGFIIFILLLLLSLTGCSTKSSSEANSSDKKLVKVNFGIDTAAGGSLQFRMAKEKGIFKKYGIDAQLSNFAYGIDTVNGMLVGRTETGIAADYALLNSLNKGDMTVVSTLTRTTKERAKDTKLLVKGNIKNAQDLKGKNLGVAKGTVYEYVWSKYLEKNKINEDDIQYVPYSTPDEAIVGLQKGNIDAVWISGALTDKFKSIDGVKEVADLNDSGVKINSYFVVQSSLVKENPEVVTNILKALDESVKYVNDHKEETAKLAFKDLKVPEDDVLKDLERFNYVIGMTEADVVHLEDMKEWLKNKKLLEQDYDLKSKIDASPVKKAVPKAVDYE
ncbi:ABC transporter substrate-binding protein [Priestia endophytica]|uniref:ABC transporter substrate-binding protein n=1 Tax=Priestia endophytica TaxID=135735 RepID=UPI000DCA4B2C|nr:ABC transporter substrate-binding protein [Priestia endophytica]KAB2492729.1 ABC transporter substrate-binding protein [Priestia endophytica]RAS85778.1 sulfonate ABC transporter substrate-binding protein [Priestia endophytica]